jgi:hypothetical protein
VRPKCAECGAVYYWLGGQWNPEEYCRRGHPPRGAQVFRGAPTWLRSALNVVYSEEIKNSFNHLEGHRTKLASQHEVESFLINHIKRGFPCLISFLDHTGRDADGNFVSEPYAKNCADCLTAAIAFAERIGVRYELTQPSWHCPWCDDCVRMTFFKPKL